MKEAGIAAFVMFALSLALIAVRVEDVPGGLAIRWRPGDVVAAVVLVFLGRLGLAFLRNHRPAPVALASGGFSLVMAILLFGSAGGGGEEATWASTWLPFKGFVVNVLVLVIAIILTLRAGLMMWRGDSSGVIDGGADVMDRIAAKVQHTAIYLLPFC